MQTTITDGNETKVSPYFCQLESECICETDIQSKINEFLSILVSDHFSSEKSKEPLSVLIIPPDYTRFHSQGGKITRFIHDFFANDNCKVAANITILPALGTHAPMTLDQIEKMFGSKLSKAAESTSSSLTDNRCDTSFVVHNWRKDVVTIGHVPAEYVTKATNGFLTDTPWPAQLNKLVWEGDFSLIISVGQVVPHEVMGFANFNKNLFVGCGGAEAINLSHFIGALYGMEHIMGKAQNPLRDILNYASQHFLPKNKLPLWYILTVMGTNPNDDQSLEMKGFYIGNDIQCYLAATDLSLKTNFTILEEPLQTVVVHLDKDEYHSTWLGNKAIYRTRMAIADGGHLIILAPGVKKFGEDEQVDYLIRKYGYKGTPAIMKAMKDNDDLKQNTSAVAHLIHGSTEGRFQVTYCSPLLSKEEVESVGFQYGDFEEMQQTYSYLKDGWNNSSSGEKVYYIRNPALGLWAVRSRLDKEEVGKTETHKTATSNDILCPTDILHQDSSDGSGGVGGWIKSPLC